MLKPYQFLLIISFLFVNTSVFAFEVENNSIQDSSEIRKFIDYLAQHHINKDENQTLIIYDVEEYWGKINIQIDMFGSRDFYFEKSIHFELTQNGDQIFDGYVIWNHVIFNAQNYFFYKNPDFARKNLDIHIKKIIKKNFADTLYIDQFASNIVNDSKEQYFGYFKLEFKTLAFHGCLIDDQYSLVEENTYMEMQEGYTDFEPVFVLYTSAPKEYTNPERFIGTEFKMFNRGYNMIHKGVISEVSMTTLRD